ncbi:hypothetical protein EOW77_0031180 [Bradyrhizobium yuanmingense]|uniref:hypothetical protein n=1 Tax=Bradyrhizobium yuanmingense TaxID=108015 RepID=UPI000FE34D9F|nr:hypothetical protein [Bradyrhizobium yuanmingense]TGN77242.1 hypothetical protein EOW77_0031180 [Bradyrhizobium yuanmingense]
MSDPPKHLLVFSSLLLAAVLVVWIGLGGPIFSEASTRGWYVVLKDWQTLVAALIALIAALVAARPVWKQLAIARAQALQTSYEQLAARSLHLHKEREALYNLTSAIDIMAKALAGLPSLDTIGGITAGVVLSVEGPHNYLTETVRIYKAELGPTWGSAEVQRSRTLMLDHALRFCSELQRLMDRIVLGSRVSKPEIEEHVPELLEHKRGAFDAANFLHNAIEAESRRIGPLIAKLEAAILTDLA